MAEKSKEEAEKKREEYDALRHNEKALPLPYAGAVDSGPRVALEHDRFLSGVRAGECKKKCGACKQNGENAAWLLRKRLLAAWGTTCKRKIGRQ